MGFDPNIHDRRSIRIPGYGYDRVGGYFVTVVTQARVCLFGDVQNDQVRFSPLGDIVLRKWFRCRVQGLRD